MDSHVAHDGFAARTGELPGKISSGELALPDAGEQHFQLDVANQCVWTAPDTDRTRCISLTTGALRLLQRLLQNDSEESREQRSSLRCTPLEAPQPSRHRACSAASQPVASRHPDALSDREMNVLRYLPTNLSAQEIAEQLSVSVHTVRTHVCHIYAKLRVHRRSQAIRKAKELGLMLKGLPLRLCECGRSV